MTSPEENSEFCFPRISIFPETKSRETLRFKENKIHCSPRDSSLSVKFFKETFALPSTSFPLGGVGFRWDQSLSDLLYSKRMVQVVA